MQKKIYGYVRVSTREQNADRQMASMREMDVPEENIYLDRMSGKDFNRPRYRKLRPMSCPKSLSPCWRKRTRMPAVFCRFCNRSGLSQKTAADFRRICRWLFMNNSGDSMILDWFVTLIMGN